MLNNRERINRYDKQSDDQLYKGDEILSVNGMALQGMSHRYFMDPSHLTYHWLSNKSDVKLGCSARRSPSSRTSRVGW